MKPAGRQPSGEAARAFTGRHAQRRRTEQPAGRPSRPGADRRSRAGSERRAQSPPAHRRGRTGASGERTGEAGDGRREARRAAAHTQAREADGTGRPAADADAEGGAPAGARGIRLDKVANVWYNVTTPRKENVRSWGSNTAHICCRPRPPTANEQPDRAIIQNAPFCLIAIEGSRSEPLAIIQNGRFVRDTTARPWRAFGGGVALVIARAGTPAKNGGVRPAAAPKEPFAAPVSLGRASSFARTPRVCLLTASAPCEGF